METVKEAGRRPNCARASEQSGERSRMRLSSVHEKCVHYAYRWVSFLSNGLTLPIFRMHVRVVYLPVHAYGSWGILMHVRLTPPGVKGSRIAAQLLSKHKLSSFELLDQQHAFESMTQAIGKIFQKNPPRAFNAWFVGCQACTAGLIECLDWEGIPHDLECSESPRTLNSKK